PQWGGIPRCGRPRGGVRGAASANRAPSEEDLLFRRFADLPIEQKLRMVITVPAMVIFAIAMVTHVATSLLHVREDLQRCALRIARVSGLNVIQALQAGD